MNIKREWAYIIRGLSSPLLCVVDLTFRFLKASHHFANSALCLFSLLLSSLNLTFQILTSGDQQRVTFLKYLEALLQGGGRRSRFKVLFSKLYETFLQQEMVLWDS